MSQVQTNIVLGGRGRIQGVCLRSPIYLIHIVFFNIFFLHIFTCFSVIIISFVYIVNLFLTWPPAKQMHIQRGCHVRISRKETE